MLRERLMIVILFCDCELVVDLTDARCDAK